MFKDQAGFHPTDRNYLDDQYCEVARDVYQTIHAAGLDKFTFSWIDTLWNDLTALVYELEHLPETGLKELMEVIEALTEARNELRLARFLFDVEEINPLYRLVMRNRAVLRSEGPLHKAIKVWPIRR